MTIPPGAVDLLALSSMRATGSGAATPRCAAALRSICITRPIRRRMVAALAEAFENQRCGADRDRAVCDVEGRIVPIMVVKQQKIHDAADDDAIVEIAERSADDERD